MRLLGIAKTMLVASLTGGLLLTSACMLSVCPLVAVAAAPIESCHSDHGDDSDPAQCPYTMAQLVYAAPIVDIALDRPAASPGPAFSPPAAAPTSAERPWALEGGRASIRSGPDRHARLCVFRI